MKFLNVGALELLFILLLAFIVLGPEKAIKTAGDVARWLRDLTKSAFWRDLVATSREIQNLPKTLMEDSEIQRTFNDLDRTTGEIRATFEEPERMIGDENEFDEENFEKDSNSHSEN